MREVLGKCPRCGADYVTGNYGPYCTGRCGFRVNRVLGKELTAEEIRSLLKGEKVLLKDLTSRRTGKHYSMYVQPKGLQEYSYTGRDGETKAGYRFDYEMTFPDWNEQTDAAGSGLTAEAGSESADDASGRTAGIKTSDTCAAVGSGNGWNDDEIPFR